MALVGTHVYGQQKTHTAVVIGPTATSSVDLNTAGFERLLLLARMTAAAANDLSVAVQAYEDDGTTLFAQALPTDTTVAAALTSGTSRLMNAYFLRGVSKVSVQVTNNHVAGAETATVIAYLFD